MATSESKPESVTPLPEESAREAGLRHVSDDMPGITRRKRGKGFTYHDPDGAILNGNVRERIESLVIPPAWEDVWISPWKNGHIQATGRDEAGRKQYIYHEKWRQVRDEAKYYRMVAFGEALPDIRKQVDKDLRRRTLCREKVLALALYLLDATGIRVGNQEYAEENGSYGLTTLRKRHVEVNGSRLRIEFVGKSGVSHELEITDRRAARAIRLCEELPGYELFRYVDEDGERRKIDSEDVNDYLQEIAGRGFTAKDFRTWVGTVTAASKLSGIEEGMEELEIKKRLVEVVKEVAEELGNTPAVCRKHYIHPEVIRSFTDGNLGDRLTPPSGRKQAMKEWMSEDELALLDFLKSCSECDD